MADCFSGVWFSYREYRYAAYRKDKNSFFKWTRFFLKWTKSLEDWDWNNCIVTAVSGSEGKIKIIIRNMHSVFSRYIGKDVTIRYMYDFDVKDIPEPEIDWYGEPPPQNTLDKKRGQEKQRWVIRLQKDKKDNKDGDENRYCWIWEWADGKKKEETTIYKIYQMLKEIKENPETPDEVFEVPVVENKEIIPIVYQPALDSWKNFVREIHCHKLGLGEYEITIILNGEQLRKHKIFDWIYRLIRKELYHRLRDVETFRILLKDKVPENFMFSGIYSNSHNIFDDDIHGDKIWFFQKKIPVHKIKYYFTNKSHPVVFINTSNHAMAEHDGNTCFWKWEYVGWDSKRPIILGNKSRKEIEEFYNRSRK